MPRVSWSRGFQMVLAIYKGKNQVEHRFALEARSTDLQSIQAKN